MTQPVILVLNAGSSSLKFQVFAKNNVEHSIASGRITDIGSHPIFAVEGETFRPLPSDCTQAAALEYLLTWLSSHADWKLVAVGHRIVHGGEFLSHQVLTDDILKTLDRLVPLAPLHQPHHLHAIRTLKKLHPHVPQVGCFDTVFHAQQSPLHRAFAIPRTYFDRGVRRYGFHGLSYEWMAGQLKSFYPDLYRSRVVGAHLGNGCSLCAMQNGESIATTMGLTALDGLPMGTRSGAIDPGAVLYLIRETGMAPEAVEAMLSYESGLLALSGISNDMREIRDAAKSNAQAQFAMDYFVQKVAQGIAQMAAAMGGLDAVVFTGGIGENESGLREKIMQQLWFIPNVVVQILAANEEAMIAQHTSKITAKIPG